MTALNSRLRGLWKNAKYPPVTASVATASAPTPAEGCRALHTTTNTAPIRPVASDCQRVGQRLSQNAAVTRVNIAEAALTTMAVMDRSSRVARYEIGTSAEDEATSAKTSCAGHSNRRCLRRWSWNRTGRAFAAM